MKGIGKVYLQTVIDYFSRYVWGRLYTSKIPVTADHVMNNDVLPSIDEQGATITTVFSNNGREFCGRPDRHPYELYLQLEEIEHRTTKVRRPQSNGYVERLHRTLLDEHSRVLGRTKFYESVDEMQADLDAYLVTYNTKRPHQGRNMRGRTPIKAFSECLPDPKREENSEKAAHTIQALERQLSGDKHLCTYYPNFAVHSSRHFRFNRFHRLSKYHSVPSRLKRVILTPYCSL